MIFFKIAQGCPIDNKNNEYSQNEGREVQCFRIKVPCRRMMRALTSDTPPAQPNEIATTV